MAQEILTLALKLAWINKSFHQCDEIPDRDILLEKFQTILHGWECKVAQTARPAAEDASPVLFTS